MSYEPLRPPLRGHDDRGRSVVRVPLASVNAHAILDAADYDALMALGVSPNWSFDGRIVMAGFRPHNTQRIARLIMNLFLKKINRHPKPDVTGQHRPL